MVSAATAGGPKLRTAPSAAPAGPITPVGLTATFTRPTTGALTTKGHSRDSPADVGRCHVPRGAPAGVGSSVGDQHEAGFLDSSRVDQCSWPVSYQDFETAMSAR